MHTPRTEINVQAGVTDVRAAAFVHGPADFIRHAPRAAVQCRRRKPDASLRWLVREVDDHEMARMLTGQADWHERIVNVRAEKVEEAPTENEPHYIGPVP